MLSMSDTETPGQEACGPELLPPELADDEVNPRRQHLRAIIEGLVACMGAERDDDRVDVAGLERMAQTSLQHFMGLVRTARQDYFDLLVTGGLDDELGAFARTMGWDVQVAEAAAEADSQ